MSVWIRRIGIALAVLVLIAVAAAAWLVASFDPNRYKGVAVDWMKTHRNRTLAIDGPIELSVFPRLAVRLSQVKLSEAARADEFAAVEHAALAVDVLPLLRGELVVGRVEARGVRARLLRDAQGRRNTDDLAGTAPADAAPTTQAPAAPGGALRFDVSRIELADVRLHVKDDSAGIDGELLLRELASGRLANGVESPVQLAAGFDFRAPALKGELTGRTRLTPELDTGSVRLADMDFGFKGDLPGARGVDLALQGALAWDGAKRALDARALALKFGAEASGVRLADSSLAIERFGYDPSRQSLAVAGLKLRLAGTRDKQPLALELDWPKLDVAGERLEGSPLAGKLSLGGELPLTAAFRSGAPTGSFEALALPGFEARLGSSGARKIDGTLRANIGIRPAKAAVTLDAIDLKASLQDKALKPIALAARGSASASAQAAQWKLAGSANKNAFAIDGSANLTGTTPFVKAQATFDALDLNTLLPETASGAAPGAPAPADAPVDLSGLRALNGDFALRAGSLVFRQYRLSDARIDAVLDAGMLKVPVLQARAWGGALSANALADARASRIAVKATASGVNANALLKDVTGKDLIEGTGRVSLDVDTVGRSVGELRSKLGGSAALQLRDGAIKGVNLAKSLRQFKAALGGRDDSTVKSVQSEKTDFSELSATFQIANGVARNKDLDVKSPFLRIGGEGAIDIGRGRIDYTTRATVASTAAGQGGADLAALKGVTIPVRLAGPFEAIDWKIQWSAVAAGALQNKLEDKLKERLGIKPATPAAPGASAPSAKDQLKEKLLKGLFK